MSAALKINGNSYVTLARMERVDAMQSKRRTGWGK
ncbi:MAG: hypothetical protein JWN00_546 [Actinomycetia bacterium]|nr:hypothetical protein [Actinomycetes bacterium]